MEKTVYPLLEVTIVNILFVPSKIYEIRVMADKINAGLMPTKVSKRFILKNLIVHFRKNEI